MSRKRMYDDPMMTPGLGASPGMSVNGAAIPPTQFYSDIGDPPVAKRNFVSDDSFYPTSWAPERFDNLGYSQRPISTNLMEYERYDPQGPLSNSNNANSDSYSIPKRKLTCEIPMPPLPEQANSKFGLGLDRYGHEQAHVLVKEFQEVVKEMREELSFFRRHPEIKRRIPHAIRVLEREAYKLENSVEPEWLEIDINKPISLTRKVLIPTARHPTFNFIGKILGSKGQTLQNLSKTFKTHILLLGEGSSRDPQKEAQLFNSGNSRYFHYGLPLYLQISTIARPHVAFERMAGLLNCLHKLLMPSHDIHIRGITDGNVWSERDDTFVYDPPIFDETGDDEKEYQIRSFCTGLVVPFGRGRGRGRGRGGPESFSRDNGEGSRLSTNSFDNAKRENGMHVEMNDDDQQASGSEFRISPSAEVSRGGIRGGRARGRGAVPIRRAKGSG